MEHNLEWSYRDILRHLSIETEYLRTFDLERGHRLFLIKRLRESIHFLIRICSHFPELNHLKESMNNLAEQLSLPVEYCEIISSKALNQYHEFMETIINIDRKMRRISKI